MSTLDTLSKTIYDTLTSANSKKPTPYDTTAEVIRVEGNTAWVHIPGGIDETPVQRTINATPGDTVQVRVSGGRAWIMGNATAPPTDDRRAEQVYTYVQTVEEKTEEVEQVAVTANTTATYAKKVATDLNQYFWTYNADEGPIGATGSTGVSGENGAHVTVIPKEEFLEDPANGGGNTLITSNGVAVRNGQTELAQFYADGVKIGQDESNFSISRQGAKHKIHNNDIFEVYTINDPDDYGKLTYHIVFWAEEEDEQGNPMPRGYAINYYYTIGVYPHTVGTAFSILDAMPLPIDGTFHLYEEFDPTTGEHGATDRWDINYDSETKKLYFSPRSQVSTELEYPVMVTYESYSLGNYFKFNSHIGEAEFDSNVIIDDKLYGKSGIFPKGYILITNSNETPAKYFGGQWSLVDKDLSYRWVSDQAYQPSIYINNEHFTCIINKKTVECRLTWYNSTAYSDNSTLICSIVLGACFGLKAGINTHDVYFQGNCDGLQATLLMRMTYTGDVYVDDIVVRGPSVSVRNSNNSGTVAVQSMSYPSSTNIYCTASWTFNMTDYNNFEDWACDKFYWQLVADDRIDNAYAMGGSSGTSDYRLLSNKPQIEGTTLEGNKTYEDLNLQPISVEDLEEIFV